MTIISHLVSTSLHLFVTHSVAQVAHHVIDLASLNPSHPRQMSLTLEEKQRLAKEQEQAAKLRNQQPLAPQAVKLASSSNTKVTSAFRLECKYKH